MTTWVSTEEKDISWEHCGRPAYWEDDEVYCSKCQEKLDDELLEHLIGLFVESITSAFSDSPYAYSAGKNAYEKGIKGQTKFTNREVWLEASKRYSFIRTPDENEN